ncbi:MAG: TIR domain-containing protein [Thaumarchaeota archaeon]|nr:TIR domain-containing protein [Nitrososphaerota archaeon]
MTRRVFFSFHYERDAWRASIVRNSGITKNVAGFIDSAEWETIESEGDDAIKRWIRDQLDGTSVTVVLIGAKTSTRRWIRYELNRSWVRGNGILGIHIHQIKDPNQLTDNKGDTKFGPKFKMKNDDGKQYFFQRFNAYDWVEDNGYQNFDRWIEAAAKQVGN